jgi:dynein intermediate chain 2
MTDVYTYSKVKGETNKPVNFSDSKNVVRIGMIPDEENEKLKLVSTDKLHAQRNPNSVNLSNFPVLSENIVNTERISTQDALVYHYEGGWPKEVDITDINE